jgi:hypothetical protein
MLAIAIGAILAVVLGVGFLLRRRPTRFNTEKFKSRWNEVENLCSKSETWPLAVINADKLLDEALKQSRFKGKTMGERLVAAQRALSNNDGVWFGHKLRNKIVHEEMPRLYRRDVQQALRGFRQALKDLGALR